MEGSNIGCGGFLLDEAGAEQPRRTRNLEETNRGGDRILWKR
jgi:hypothetical protein